MRSIRAQVPYQGTVYQLLLPHGREDFTTGTYQQRIDALEGLATRLGQQVSKPVLVSLSATVSSFRGTLNTLWNAQNSAEVAAASARTAIETLRVTAARQLFRNTGFAMTVWNSELNLPKIEALFDMALVRGDTQPIALQSRIAKFAVAFIAIRAAAGVVTAGFDRFKQALDVGGQLNDLSANTGIAVADLVVLQQEFANAGKSAEDIGPVFGKMAKTLQGGSADDTIKKLGINLDELKKKTPAEQFRTLGTAINTIQDPSQKAAASMEIFGRSGAELLALFSSDGFGDAANQVGSQAQILAKDAALFDDVSDKLALTGLKVRGFWVGVAEKVAPVLKPLLDKFASLDLASWGQKAGEAVAFIVQAFADGKVGDILFTSAKIAFANAVNFLAGTLMAVAQALWQALVEAVKNAITLFQIVTTADFWIGMGKAIMGIAQGFIAFLLDGIAKLLDWLSGIPLIGDEIGEGAKEVQSWADGVRAASDENKRASADLLTPAFDKAGNPRTLGGAQAAITDHTKPTTVARAAASCRASIG